MKFHVLSDIHLEFYKNYPGFDTFVKDPTGAEALCLCGDIGDPFSASYKSFLQDCSKCPYFYVFLISGNHEYYGHHIYRVNHAIKALCAEISPKLIYLNNQAFDIPHTNLRVVGTTLWSNIHDEQRSDARCFVADFRQIKEWDIERNNQKNAKCIQFIQCEICSCARKLVVLTHHAPTLSCGNPIHMGSPISSVFKNDLHAFISENSHRIVAWMYGHDHFSKRYKKQDTLIVSNQYGYPGEYDRTVYEDCVVDL